MFVRGWDRKRVWAATVTIGLVGLIPTKLMANPLFIMPGNVPFGGFFPGFVVHLLPVGPLPLPPGGTTGPIPFTDFMNNVNDPHHWEIELHNGSAAVQSSNVQITIPGGGIAFLGNIGLNPGASVYWHITYADVPEVGGNYIFKADNPVGGVFGWTIDSDVLEYNFPIVGPPPGGPFFIGGGGAGGLIGGLPIMQFDLSLVPVPEPSAILAWAATVLGFAATARRFRSHRKLQAAV